MQNVTFNTKTTALEVIEAYKTNLNGYECIITGASTGIGIETARALAKAGARVIIGARDVDKAEKVAETLRKETNNNQIEVELLELSSLKSVNEFVRRFLSKNRPLHILINNAGIMHGPLTYTKDGFESQFGTNHIGHFALTVGVLPALKRGAKESGRNVRVVSLTSLGHIRSDIHFDDINFKKREYEGWLGYGISYITLYI
jgi:NAD(P)-dependent dehydrogenase (short-subunit alcohol dehydrogenase family)